MHTAKIYIVEDEALIADHLAILLEELQYQIVGIADNGKEALTGIEKTQPDLVLLDINLRGDLDGVDIAHRINQSSKVPFIFITSHSDSGTIERLKVTQPAGYISKPYTQEDLGSNVSIALYKQAQNQTIPVSAASPHKPVADHFFVKEKHALIKILFKKILYAEAMDNYTRLHTQEGRFVLSSTLKAVEQRLKPFGFLRVHRSYVVNLPHIDQIFPRHLLLGKAEVPLSESARQTLLEHIQTF